MNNTEQRYGLLYTLFAFLGVLAPWIWATGMICFCLDRIVLYLAKGREDEMVKLIKRETMQERLKISQLETEIERLKNKR